MSIELGETRLTKDIVLANIPAFPPIVLRVLDLLSSENPDMAQLVNDIASDATLSAQVLRMANSPLFGLSAQIDTVQHAITTLGLVRVQSLVMAVATTSYMRAALRTEALQKTWRHTLATAILSRELARAGEMPPERAYSLGLLHDIGRLGLLVAYPDDYDQILKVADRDSVSLLDQEQKLFGLDHCEAGRRLMEQWKLPHEFCVIVGRHHDPPSGGALDSLMVSYLACQMADTLGYSVVTPLKPMAFDDLRALLPVSARGKFPDDPLLLMEMVDRAIGSDTLAADLPTPDRRPAPPAKIEAAPPPPADSKAGNAAAEPSLFTSMHSSSMAWDFTVVVVTVLVFAVVLAGSYWLWNM
jgi:putative nucleotidyltransferase with HDIG domain